MQPLPANATPEMRTLPKLIFMSRWLQLPLYLGLIAAQGVYVCHFLIELLHLIEAAFGSQVAIGALAKSEEQAIIFSLIPMFVFAGLGGAWVPLEITGPTFAAIGHLSPVAWAMDGFKNISVRGLGLESVLLPAAALVVYAILFFGIAAWSFQRSQEQ